jgi:hypothetical protein
MRLVRSGAVPGRTRLTFVPLRQGRTCAIDRGMASRTTNRRSLALIVAGSALLLVAGAGWIYAAPKGAPIPWRLVGMGGANSSLAEMQMNDPLVVRVHVEQWPVDRTDDSWLVQSVDETSSTVTITLRLSPDYPVPKDLPESGGWYDTGGWVNVHLHAPLGDRPLIDGATGQRAVVPAAANP